MTALADLLSDQDRRRLEELGLIGPKAEPEPPGETAGQDRDNGYRRKHVGVTPSGGRHSRRKQSGLPEKICHLL